MTSHKTGTREESLAGRLELLEAEKELTRRTTPTRRTHAGWTACGARTSGSTARRSAVTRLACGGAATTSTAASEIMANSAPGGASDYNAKIIEEFRANRGRVGGPWAGTPMVLIHHIGAKSGIERVSPLACSPQGDGSFAIVASNGGSAAHPDWYYNLKANPKIKVEVGTQVFTALAEELDGAARAGLWPKLVAEAPAVGEFQDKTTRQIPVFMLTHQDWSAGSPQ
jgi:deazaflavin-dependent oxidoreductase (nitroreductase family)